MAELATNEDLMREHGILRRVLLVYRLSASKLNAGQSLPAPPIHRAAQLFRDFGEDYHERAVEERYVFPPLRDHGGDMALLVDTLVRQHNCGRQITEYVLDVTKAGSIPSGDVEPLVRALDTLTLMYEEHAAREDTVVFPAWKQALSGSQYRDYEETFDQLEQKTFGAGGFEEARDQITQIEKALGIDDLAGFTAPAPPRP